MYDGFISYSHAADDLLAPRLQAGLQRFAKPWWKRRALRIFRDESSLSANPHLWASITKALDDSGWFVLLLSPDAAQSEWVNQEIDYWKTHKDSSRILPVLTDGEFAWDGSDVTGSAVPDKLSGVFSEEPRWVDLQFARGEEHLDLKVPRFADAVADIASALRGVPKDDLASEEVKQHRRTVRTAWAAGLALFALAITAVGFGIQSANNAAEAARQAENARVAEAEAQAKAAEAETQRGVAVANEEQARQNETRARAVALASAALASLESDPELAVLLSIQSLLTTPTDEAASALGTAVQAHRSLLELQPGDGFASGKISPNGEYVVYGRWNDSVDVYEIEDPTTPIWSMPASEGRSLEGPTYTGDGNQIVVFERPEFDEDRQLAAEPGRLLVLDSQSGQLVSSSDVPPCIGIHLPRSPSIDLSKPFFAFGSGAADEGVCDFDGFPPLSLFTFATGELTLIGDWNQAFLTQGDPTWSQDGSRYAYAQEFGGAVVDAASGETLMELPRGHSTLNTDGTLILRGVRPLELWDVDEGMKVREYPGSPNIAAFSPDESMVYTGDADGSMVVFDTQTGQELIRLRGQGSEAVEVSMSDDQTFMATGSVDGTLRVWRIGSFMIGDAGLPDLSTKGDLFWGDIQSSGDVLAVNSVADLTVASFTSTFHDATSLDPLAEISGAVHAISADGSVAASQWYGDVIELSEEESEGHGPAGRYVQTGPIQLVETATGDLITTLEGPCRYFGRNGSEVPGPDCGEFPGPWMEWVTDMDFSPDGRSIAMGGAAGVTVVWDVETGEIIWQEQTELGERFPDGFGRVAFAPDGSWLAHTWFPEHRIRIVETSTWSEIAVVEHPYEQFISVLDVTPDGSTLLAGDNLHDVMVIDTATWTIGEPLSGQQGNFMNDIDVSPGGRFVATAGFDGETWVWDLQTRKVVRKWASLGGRIESVEFLDEETLLVIPLIFPEAPSAVALTMNPEEQLAYARSTLTRTFTADECRTYDIDPCPTLQELRDD